MKFFNLFFFIAFFSILSTSCEDKMPPEIEGDWALTNYNYSIETIKDSFNLNTVILSEGTANNISMELSFTNNQNVFNSSGSYDLSSTFNEDGITYPRTYEDIAFGFDGATWASTDTSLTISQNNDELEFEIIELTETTLKLNFNFSWQYFDNSVNIFYKNEQNATYTLSRL